MDFSQPFRALTPTLDGPVLRVLARTTQPMTRRQVADLIGDASEAGVRKVLRRLSGQGVVIEQRMGSQYTYLGNREHIAWPAVEVLMGAAARLESAVRAHVGAWEVPALSVELFGSVADGSSSADSDVDLMVYRSTLGEDQENLWNHQLAELRMAVERWTGNTCEILEIDALSLVEMAAEDEPVLRATRVRISGLDVAAAVPSVEMARTLRKALADSDAKTSLDRVASSLSADLVIGPQLQRTLNELNKIVASATVRVDEARATAERGVADEPAGTAGSSDRRDGAPSGRVDPR